MLACLFLELFRYNTAVGQMVGKIGLWKAGSKILYSKGLNRLWKSQQ